MFGKNEIVGQKYFRDADRLLVTSIFYTLQGEGPFAGLPAIFVRLAKCNLACDFCDTWFDSGEWMTPHEILNKAEDTIDLYFKDNVPNWAQYLGTGKTTREIVLVVTGGEPTLQNNMLEKFCYEASREYRHIQIETNGILEPDVPYLTTIVCSPKCVNGKYIKPHKSCFEHIRRDAGKFFFKFVIEEDANSPYHEIPDWKELKDFPIYISPMNTYKRQSEKFEISSFWTPGLLDHEQNQKNHEYAAQYCMKHGYRLNLQMHLYTSLA